jgi:tetratricopeptide (TPR) repeat protein/tRNA A-37 threonylcarbamoyl transferase component Bud32
MNEEFWVQVEEAYNQAAELPSNARITFLATAYGERPDVQHEVEALLEHQEAAQRLSQSTVLMAAAEMFNDDEELFGKIIADKYVIRERLGSGGMAEVYRADHIALEMPFALKRPRPEWRIDPEFRKTFLEEARRAVILKHENVARVHDVIEAGEDMFVVMEYIEGDTLERRITDLARPFRIDEFLPIAIQCASALVAAHEKRIVHLDVKPANIMLTPQGQVKVCDFGVARRLSSDTSSTTTALSDSRWAVAGTPAYMAPEVVLNIQFDERADIFSLGTVFYEMLTGQNPFRSDTAIATTARVVSHTPLPISETTPDFDSRLERILTRMMAKDPGERYATAIDLVEDLTALSRARNRFQDLGQSIREAFAESRWMKVAVAVVVLLALIGAAPVWIYRDRLHRWVGLSQFVQKNTLMVFPFRVAKDSLSPFYADGLANLLAGKLSALKRFDVVSMREVSESGITKPSDAFSRLGADVAVTGDIYATGQELQIVLSLIDGKDGKQLGQKTVTTPSFNSLTVETQITNAVVGLLKLELSPEELLALGSQGTDNSKAHALYVEGKGYLASRKPEDIDIAIGLFQVAIAEDSNFSPAYAGLGMAFRSKFEVGPRDPHWVKRAISNCDQAVSLDRNLAAGHICLGAIYKLRGEYERAIEEYNLARQLTLDPLEIYEIWEGLGRAHEESNNVEAAEATYKMAIQTRPEHWYGYVWLAQFYLNASPPEYADATKLYEEGINRAPDHPVAHLGLCAAHIMSGTYLEAIKACSTSISKQENYRAYINLGLAYFRLNKYAEAVEAFSRARTLEPRYYKTPGHLARTYFWMGRTAEASALYSEAIRLADEELGVNPKSASVHAMLARYHAMLRHRELAFQHLQIALQARPNEPEYQCIAAVVHNQFGERTAAIDYLEKAIDFNYSLTEIDAERELDNLREEPRFRALIAGRTARR